MQQAGPLPREDSAEVVVHKPRMEDPTFLFLPFPQAPRSPDGGGTLLPAAVKTVK